MSFVLHRIWTTWNGWVGKGMEAKGFWDGLRWFLICVFSGFFVCYVASIPVVGAVAYLTADWSVLWHWMWQTGAMWTGIALAVSLFNCLLYAGVFYRGD